MRTSNHMSGSLHDIRTEPMLYMRTWLWAVFFGVLFSVPLVVSAQVKDTDADGVTDRAETDIYHTDPSNFDTDNDGVGDGEEIATGTNPTDAADSQLATLQVASDPGILGERDKFAWYFARATGIAAFILLTFAMVFGMTVSSRAFVGKLNLGNMLELHRTVSWLAFALVALHAASFLFDDFLRMTIVEILVPFVLERDFPTVLGYDIGKTVALGIIAFYLILMLMITAELRTRATARFWRQLHYFSFLAYPLFVAHGFLSGTDAEEWWMQGIYVSSVAIVTLMIFTRIIFRNILPKIRARKAAQAPPSLPLQQ